MVTAFDTTNDLSKEKGLALYDIPRTHDKQVIMVNYDCIFLKFIHIVCRLIAISLFFRHSSGRHHGINDDDVIVVSAVRDIDNLQSTEIRYQTLLVSPSEQGGEQEVMFFERLDDEFNKVNMFYKSKEAEVVAEADELSRQMNSLISLRVRVERPHLAGVARADHVEVEASHTAPSARHSISSIRPGN